MKNKGIIEVTTPDGTTIAAVALLKIFELEDSSIYVCYSQNRLFTYIVDNVFLYVDGDLQDIGYSNFGKVICDYCVIPELDELLSSYKINDVDIELSL